MDEIADKIYKHNREILECQDDLFNFIEVNQYPPLVALGGLVSCSISLMEAIEQEDDEVGDSLKNVVKKMFMLSGVEL